MSLGELVLAVLEINALIVIVLLIREERDPSTTLAWAFALLLLPVVGVVAYLLLGMNWRGVGGRDPVRLEAKASGEAAIRPLYERHADDASAAIASRPPLVRRLSIAITRQCATMPLPCENLEVFTGGGPKFDRLFEDVSAARESVHLQYFIWEEDELSGRLCDLLAEKVAQGVEVRVLYDWVGSLVYGKGQLRKLRAAGALVRTDRPHLRWLNYRDHRKIAVVDGRIGYTGGLNVGQEYVDGGRRFATWRDTHCRFTGPLVAEMQRTFVTRWYRLSGERLFSARYFPELEIEGGRPVWAQLAHSGPESEWQAVRNAFLLCIAGAERRLWIQSPYFVPDEAIMEALNVQSLAGVDLRFMMAGVPDKRSAWYAAFSYIDDLLHAGGRMLQYSAGFFHPKTITVDSHLAVIGTTNFDIRSFALHDEMSVFFFDEDAASTLERMFEEDSAHCHEIDDSYYERMSPAERYRNAVMRLWSRLL